MSDENKEKQPSAIGEEENKDKVQCTKCPVRLYRRNLPRHMKLHEPKLLKQDDDVESICCQSKGSHYLVMSAQDVRELDQMGRAQERDVLSEMNDKPNDSPEFDFPAQAKPALLFDALSNQDHLNWVQPLPAYRQPYSARDSMTDKVKPEDAMKLVYECMSDKGDQYELKSTLPFFQSATCFNYLTQRKPEQLLELCRSLTAQNLSPQEWAGLVALIFAYSTDHALDVLRELWLTCKDSIGSSQLLVYAKKTLTCICGNADVAEWYLCNIIHIDNQAVKVGFALPHSVQTSYSATIMQCQRAIDLSQEAKLNDYLRSLAKVINDHRDKQQFLQLLDRSLNLAPKQQRLTKAEFHYLLDCNSGDNRCEIDEKIRTLRDWVKFFQQPAVLKENVNEEVVLKIVQEFKERFQSDVQDFGACVSSLLGEGSIDFWQQVGATPTSMQAAIATFVAGTIDHQPKQLWEVASGTGKTLMQAAAILRIVQQEGVSTIFRAVTSSMALCERDKALFGPIWHNMGIKVEYATTMRIPRSGESLVMFVDEADVKIFDKPQLFFSAVAEVPRVILFTGSLGDNCKNSLRKVMREHNFAIFEANSEGIRTPSLDKIVPEESLLALIKQELSRRPVIVFGKSTDYFGLPPELGHLFTIDIEKKNPLVMHTGEQSVSNTALSTNLSSLSIFLDQYLADNQLYPLISAQNDDDLRGLDFRAPKTGILLVIAKPFKNQRAFIQAMGRVGRYGDKCQRWKVEGVADYDVQSEAQSIGPLLRLGLGSQPKPNQPKPATHRQAILMGNKAIKQPVTQTFQQALHQFAQPNQKRPKQE